MLKSDTAIAFRLILLLYNQASALSHVATLQTPRHMLQIFAVTRSKLPHYGAKPTFREQLKISQSFVSSSLLRPHTDRQKFDI